MKCLDIINILRRGKYKIQKIMSENRKERKTKNKSFQRRKENI